MPDPYQDFAIYGRDESGLAVADDSYKFGKLGEVEYVTIHHSAGPMAPTKATCQRLNRSYQIYHEDKGWGDVAYHFCVDDLGRFYRLRPHDAKGTHTADTNSRNIGIMFHGNFDFNELTTGHRGAIEWLFKGGFYQLFGEPEAGVKLVRGHREWPGQSTACPGTNLLRHLAWRRSVDLH